MKFLFVLALSAMLAIGSCKPTKEDIKTFEHFKKFFGKTYANAEEEARRERQFLKQLKWIEENQGKHGATYKINRYSDMSEEEFSTHLSGGANYTDLMYKATLNKPEFAVYDSLPTNFDWREKAHLSPIRNQGACGSCWAFAAVGVTESLYAIFKNRTVVLSEQELVDCTLVFYDWSYRNLGCGSGFPDQAFRYINENGIVEEDNYPYEAATEWCDPDAEGERFTVQDYDQLQYRATDESIMSAIMKYGPVVILIHGSNGYFRNLDDGILRGVDYDDGFTDHAVSLVGWGTKDGVDYWIIRNSWGNEWGSDGYGYVERHHNSLGINNVATYAML